MPRQRTPTGTAGTPEPRGTVTGHLLQLIRDHIGHTQETLAEHLRVDLNTLKSWESGRRPLANTKVADLRGILRRLRLLGGDPVLLDLLDTAVDVDLFLSDVLNRTQSPAEHPLGCWVSTRAWNDLLAWTLAGSTPSALRHLPGQIPRPRMPAADRARLFDSLRTTAEQAAGLNGSAVLLRRQAYFMTAWDPASADWLARMERQELRQFRRGDGWTPTWVAGRSLAVARACQGDPGQLRHFIDRQLINDDRCEAANLNYWAYWIGEHGGHATSDEFMAAGLGRWRGAALLAHLTVGLSLSTPYVELSIHSVWALLQRRPYLLDDDPAVTADLSERVTRLLDGWSTLTDQARRELDQVAYAARLRGPR